LPELVRRLRRLAGAADLPAPLREQARALLDAARSLPTAVGRGGTVFAAWLDLPGPEGGHYAAYWDASPDASCFLEQGPGTADLDALLAWADERSDRVVVRPSWDPSHHYWAGRAGRPATTPPLRRPGPGEPAPA
jgi:hypothetical protein